jgi:hypothetical protein
VIVTEGGNEEAIQIYDTPGRLFSLDNIKEMTYDQEHYLSIGDGFLLVYDITSKASFDLVKVLRQRIILRYKEVPVIIVGNKYDLDGIRQVTFEKAMEWARHFGINIYETSVLDRDSLRDPFTYITWSMANPGKPTPANIQSSFSHFSARKSFTIPQTRSRHHNDEPLLSAVAVPTTAKQDTPPPSIHPLDSPSTRSISSTPSDYSFTSRISSRPIPPDAHYPRSGLFGLGDCMSNRKQNY